MELNADDTNNWGINYYKFAEDTNGYGRVGFAGTGLSSLAPNANESGLILGFGSGSTVTVDIAGQELEVPSLTGLISFLKSHRGGNILSTPQITAIDNEEAEIEVGENVPISLNSTSTTTATSANVERQDLTLKLKITPYISPDTDSVRMKIDQKIKALSNRTVSATNLQSNAVSFNTRSIVTNVVVNSADTAVLGGLMQDQEEETTTKVPVLGDIPIIGWLFKSKSVQKRKQNLLVFITPQILRNSQDNADLVNDKLNERVDFIQQNLKGRDPHGFEVDKMPRRALVSPDSQEFIDEPVNIQDNTTVPDPDQQTPTEPENILPGDLEEGE